MQQTSFPQVAAFLIDPMCRGICAGDAKAISVRSLLPMAYNAEQRHGSVIRGLTKGEPCSAACRLTRCNYYMTNAHSWIRLIECRVSYHD